MTYRNKLFLSIFVTSIFIAILFLFLSYEYLSKKIKTDYLNQYVFAASNLGSSLNQLEWQTDKILESAANYLALYVEKNGVPSEEKMQRLKKQLHIDETYIINSQGNFIRSTKEAPNVLPNFFGFCPLYHQWYEANQAFMPTGLLPGIPSGMPFKFFTIVTPDKRYLIEIGVQTTFIGKSLENIANNDKNILSIELYSPNGTGLGAFSNQGIEYNKNFHFPINTPEIMWDRDKIEINKNVPANFDFCCSCIRRGIVLPDQKYFYRLRLVASTKPLKLYYHRLFYIFLLSAMSCLLFSYFVSKLLSNILVSRIRRIDAKIDTAIQSNNFAPRLEIKGNDEVSHLAKHFNHMLDAAFEKQKKEIETEKKIALGQIAAQIAHDIRSPSAAIVMFAQNSENLPENQRVLLRDAATRVQDIANNILTEYQQKSSELKNIPMMLAPAILSVISEKRAQYHNRQLKITTNISQPAYFVHIKINPVEFKRVFSNLINNAVEALDTTIIGNINIEIKVENENVTIRIQDNGHGINSESLMQLNSGNQVQSSKKEGLGLGLQHARKLIQESNGILSFESNINSGACVILSFKQVPTPCWLTEKIFFHQNQEIIILDDDEAIHGAWNQKFTIWKKRFPALTIKHFHHANDCLNYIRSLSPSRRNQVLLLSDYELINQNITGLDLIEQSDISSAILVTSYYENEDIIKRAILANTKILPKMLAPEVDFAITTHIEKKPSKKVDGILLDNQAELSSIIQFLAKSRKNNLDVYSTPYQLWENLERYSKDTAFYLDYDLELPITGVDIAKRLYAKQYKMLYLATGYQMNQADFPAYLKILPDKMALLNTVIVDRKKD